MHECTFRVNKIHQYVRFGVIPVTEATSTQPGHLVGYEYNSLGQFYAVSGWPPAARFGVGYGKGDEITVVLDLYASTVGFRKNNNAVGEPQPIPRDAAFHFSFDTNGDGDSATIIELR